MKWAIEEYGEFIALFIICFAVCMFYFSVVDMAISGSHSKIVSIINSIGG